MDTHRFEHLTSGLFLPLFALTAILLLMVKVPPWGYEPVQSLNMFSNLPVFAVLYAIWLSLLLFLLWRVGTLWEAALVVSLFVLVHVGAQTLATSFGAAEDWLRGADSVEVQQAGRLDFTSYADYPGLATIGAFLAIVTDVDILALRPPLLLIWLVALSTLLLVGYSRLFGSVRLAALAVLVAIQSNVMLARFSFHPGHVGPLLVVALLGYLSARERPL